MNAALISRIPLPAEVKVRIFLKKHPCQMIPTQGVIRNNLSMNAEINRVAVRSSHAKLGLPGTKYFTNGINPKTAATAYTEMLARSFETEARLSR
jgi:hypothetical protein